MNELNSIVFGATSSVGHALALKLKASGRRLILHGSNSKKLSALRNYFPDAILWEYDLKEIAKLEEDFAGFLQLNKLIVNEFIFTPGVIKPLPVKSINTVTIQDTFAVNVFSAMILVKILSNYKFNKRNLSKIIFISSNISGFGSKGTSVYGASKAALDGFMQSCAIELAPHVRVNSVLPGAMLTPMTTSILNDKKMVDDATQKYPLGLLSPKDVANYVYFLLSDESKFISGQKLYIDGGRTINLSF